MRRRRKGLQDDGDAVDVTPMLDIVFIMLIFFIVTATFLNETGLDFTQPRDSGDSDGTPKPVIAVYVDEQSLCSVEGEPRECTEVDLAVEGHLANKPGATVAIQVHYASDHAVQVLLKDRFKKRNQNTKIEYVGKDL